MPQHAKDYERLHVKLQKDIALELAEVSKEENKTKTEIVENSLAEYFKKRKKETAN